MYTLDPRAENTLWRDHQFVTFAVVGGLGVALALVEAIRYNYCYQPKTIRSIIDLLIIPYL